jgi:hypothetical protein
VKGEKGDDDNEEEKEEEENVSPVFGEMPEDDMYIQVEQGVAVDNIDGREIWIYPQMQHPQIYPIMNLSRILQFCNKYLHHNTTNSNQSILKDHPPPSQNF